MKLLFDFKLEKPVTDATGVKKPKSSSMHNIIDAARGGLLAYGTVYSSLESSAKVLGNSLKVCLKKVVFVKKNQIYYLKVGTSVIIKKGTKKMERYTMGW